MAPLYFTGNYVVGATMSHTIECTMHTGGTRLLDSIQMVLQVSIHGHGCVGCVNKLTSGDTKTSPLSHAPQTTRLNFCRLM